MNYLEQVRGRGLPLQAGVIAVLLALSGFAMILMLAIPLFTVVTWLVSGMPMPYGAFAQATLRFDIPQGVWVAHLSLALLIIVSLALGRWVLKISWRQFVSVQPGIRWRYLVAVALVCAPVMAAASWAIMFAGKPLQPQPGFWAFLIPILLLSGLQGAGEEFFFRGLLPMSLGVLIRPWAAIVGSAAVFAFLHGQQSLPLFTDRFAFGLIAGALTLVTGGLEAAIALHGVNNILAFCGWGLFATVAQARTMSDISWAQCAVDIALYAVLALISWWLARRMHLATTVDTDLAHKAMVR